MEDQEKREVLKEAVQTVLKLYDVAKPPEGSGFAMKPVEWLEYLQRVHDGERARAERGLIEPWNTRLLDAQAANGRLQARIEFLDKAQTGATDLVKEHVETINALQKRNGELEARWKRDVAEAGDLPARHQALQDHVSKMAVEMGQQAERINELKASVAYWQKAEADGIKQSQAKVAELKAENATLVRQKMATEDTLARQHDKTNALAIERDKLAERLGNMEKDLRLALLQRDEKKNLAEEWQGKLEQCRGALREKSDEITEQGRVDQMLRRELSQGHLKVRELTAMVEFRDKEIARLSALIPQAVDTGLVDQQKARIEKLEGDLELLRVQKREADRDRAKLQEDNAFKDSVITTQATQAKAVQAQAADLQQRIRDAKARLGNP